MDSKKSYPDIISYFKKYNDEYFGEVFQNNMDNAAYKAAMADIDKASEAFQDQLMDPDSPMQEFVTALHQEAWVEGELLYAQGIRDSVAVLRFMGLLS